MFIGDLFIDEGIHIEVNSLQMKDQVLRSFADSCLLGDIGLLIAKITVIVTDQLSKDESLKRFCKILGVLHLKSQRIEIFLNFLGLLAIMTTEEVGRLSCVKVINQFSQRMLLDSDLQAIEEHRYEFLNILLDHDID